MIFEHRGEVIKRRRDVSILESDRFSERFSNNRSRLFQIPRVRLTDCAPPDNRIFQFRFVIKAYTGAMCFNWPSSGCTSAIYFQLAGSNNDFHNSLIFSFVFRYFLFFFRHYQFNTVFEQVISCSYKSSLCKGKRTSCSYSVWPVMCK